MIKTFPDDLKYQKGYSERICSVLKQYVFRVKTFINWVGKEKFLEANFYSKDRNKKATPVMDSWDRSNSEQT